MKSREASSQVRSETDVEAINRAREAFFRAFNANDLDGSMARVTDDAVLMGHGGPPPLIGTGGTGRQSRGLKPAQNGTLRHGARGPSSGNALMAS